MDNFYKQMQILLKDEYNDFINELEKPSIKALRINNFKTNDDFITKQINLTKHPFVDHAYYFNNNQQLGKHYLHNTGFYYIQDSSAMLVAKILNPNKTDIVLDLCAAPGSKTTHLASIMNNEGIIIANEIDSNRAKKLSSNIERLGISNTIITNNNSSQLKKRFKNYFTKIVVDAPCSGEGMFRKNKQSIDTWSEAKIVECCNIQQTLLADSYEMLVDDGYLIYSTCTYELAENEQMIKDFINNFNMKLIMIEPLDNVSRGIDLPEAIRLWPHKYKGEGHFICLMQKTTSNNKTNKIDLVKTTINNQQLQLFNNFCKQYLKKELFGILHPHQNHLYLLKDNFPKIEKLKLVRYGLYLGEFKKNRFEPSHALAQYLKKEDVIISYELNEDEIKTYLSGQSIINNNQKGYVLLTINNHGIAWGKASDNQIKNLYPKGLRIS